MQVDVDASEGLSQSGDCTSRIRTETTGGGSDVAGAGDANPCTGGGVQRTPDGPGEAVPGSDDVNNSGRRAIVESAFAVIARGECPPPRNLLEFVALHRAVRVGLEQFPDLGTPAIHLFLRGLREIITGESA